MIVLAAVIAGFGVAMILLAGAGLLRLPDVYQRGHAAGKAATLGVCSILLGVAFALGEPGAWARAGLAVAFLFLTIPVGAQLIARAALRNGAPPQPGTRRDARLCEDDPES
ncbi:MAG: monovalent cation/H(+) antiporter subunit G [Candidatus Krumholzibacteria bacterium]|nr:monovalent cation/H(+) antiporter subunit G [Candidatus Krumholzibacteria bacterium]